MRVILYTPDYTGPKSCGHIVTMALSEGLTKLGVEHDVRKTRDFERDGSEIADIAIVNGWTKKFISARGQKNRNQVIKAQGEAGKPAWCIERAFIGDREANSAMSIGGFAATGDFRAEGMPSDRWDKLGIELQPWRTGGNHILLCAQVPWDAQVDDGNHIEWLEKTAVEIKKHTDRPILFRGHPKAWRQRDPYGKLSREFWSIVECGNRWSSRQFAPGHFDIEKRPADESLSPPQTTFEEDLAGAHAVVCYNSNVATLAVIAGVPVFTGAPCLADPISCVDISLIEHIDMIESFPEDIQQWANDIAYKQWHTDEFKESIPFLHLTRMTYDQRCEAFRTQNDPPNKVPPWQR